MLFSRSDNLLEQVDLSVFNTFTFPTEMSVIGFVNESKFPLLGLTLPMRSE